MRPATADLRERLRRFRRAYGSHRAAEGRGAGGVTELLALPYLDAGPHAREWRVRARTFDRFLAAVLAPRAREVPTRPLRVLDAGAGNGWLCHRLARDGHRPLALDLRTDDADGLGAARDYAAHLTRMFPRAAASFEHLPFAGRTFDLTVFNAAIHYALDLRRVLAEAVRVTAPGGRIAILDSPFYGRCADGDAMVAHKRRTGAATFGALEQDLLSVPVIEYLTPATLADASRTLGLAWRRHRVRYPLWYELRPLVAAVRRRRRPSRFDVWEAAVP